MRIFTVDYIASRYNNVFMSKTGRHERPHNRETSSPLFPAGWLALVRRGFKVSRQLDSINQAKRRALFDAAIALLPGRGPRTSPSDIAKRSAVSRKTLYNHFAGNAELLNALLATGAPCPACSPPSSEAAFSAYAAVLLEWVHGPRQASGVRALVRSFNLSPEQAAQLHVASLAPALRSPERLMVAETLNGRLAVDQPAQAADLFLNMVITRRQLEIIQGADVTMTPGEITAQSRLCGRVFAKGYARDRASVVYPHGPEDRRIDAVSSRAMQA